MPRTVLGPPQADISGWGAAVDHQVNVVVLHNSWKVKEQPMGRGLELTLIIDGAAMRCGIE